MRIWLDITNSPHVLFFAPIVRELEKKGHKVLITSREHSQTTGLLKLHGMKSTVVGKHAGASLLSKALYVPVRISSLIKCLRNEKIDACVVHQSFYGILAALLLGVKKRVYIFDNEKAFFQNILAIPFATNVLCPEAITQERMFFRKLKKYPGIKEAVYLSDFKPDIKIIRKLGLSAEKKIIVMRPEPYSAAYYSKGKNVLYPLIEEIIEKKKTWQVVVIPRDKKQRNDFKKAFSKKIVVAEKAIDALSLMAFADAVVGAGGTMNREAAVLGVPVVSLYQGGLLASDKWLIEKGLMKHTDSVLLADVDDLISSKRRKTGILNGKKGIMDAILK